MAHPVLAPRSRFFDHYAAGRPPWDIGRPQPAIVALAERLEGRILDVGCGTGEHALFFAARGHEAWGLDMVPLAIEQARAKAAARGLSARFEVGDARALDKLGPRFHGVVDSGLFHTLSDEDRVAYVDSLGRVMVPGSRLVLLCFSEAEPGEGGPRRVRADELVSAFADGFEVERVDAATFAASSVHPSPPKAWRALVRRR